MTVDALCVIVFVALLVALTTGVSVVIGLPVRALLTTLRWLG